MVTTQLPLVNDVGRTLDSVTHEVRLHKSSVSRIVNGKQNLSGTGKGGPSWGIRRKAGIVPLDYGPFMKAAKSIIATMDSEQHPEDVLWTLAHDEQALSIIKRLCQAATQLLNEQAIEAAK